MVCFLDTTIERKHFWIRHSHMITVTLMHLSEYAIDPLRTDWLSQLLMQQPGAREGFVDLMKTILMLFYVGLIVFFQPFRSRTNWKQDVVIAAGLGVLLIEFGALLCSGMEAPSSGVPYHSNCATLKDTEMPDVCYDGLEYFQIVSAAAVFVYVCWAYLAYISKFKERRRSEKARNMNVNVNVNESGDVEMVNHRRDQLRLVLRKPDIRAVSILAVSIMAVIIATILAVIITIILAVIVTIILAVIITIIMATILFPIFKLFFFQFKNKNLFLKTLPHGEPRRLPAERWRSRFVHGAICACTSKGVWISCAAKHRSSKIGIENSTAAA